MVVSLSSVYRQFIVRGYRLLQGRGKVGRQGITDLTFPENVLTKTLNAVTREEAEKEIESILQEEIKLSAIDSKITYMHHVVVSSA